MNFDECIFRTLRIRIGNSIASCYVHDHDNRQYIVSANHAFSEFSGFIELSHEGKWVKKDAKIVGAGSSDMDIIVLCIEHPIIKSVNPGFGGTFSLAQDLLFLGFPYNMTNEFGGYSSPLVKRAMLSGHKRVNGTDILYLDGHNNPGFSGGPVLYIDATDPAALKLKVISIVSGYIHEDKPVYYEKSGDSNFTYKYNTGIMRTISSRHAHDIIIANPIGPAIF